MSLLSVRLSHRTIRLLLPALCGGLLLTSGSGCNSQSQPAQTTADSKTSPAAANGSDPVPAATSGSASAAGSDSQWRFIERTADSGVSFTYRNGEEAGNFSILESLGGGVAVLDFDADGHDDLCAAGGGRFDGKSILPLPTGLYRGRSNWKFQDVGQLANVTDNAFYSHGIARSDYNLDGFSDFLVTGYGGLQLYINCGDGTFQLQSDTCGLDDRQWSSSAAWGDLNADGCPDLYAAHYVNWSWDNDPFCKGGPDNGREICPPRSYTGLTDALYFSNGDGTFRNATSENPLKPEGKGLGVLIGDFDLDSDNDIYVTNDTVSNFLYENDGSGKLTDISLASGSSLSSLGVPDGSMGIDACDFNADGQPDIWVVNYERETNAMYQNSGRMVFRHVSQRIGLNAVGGAWVGWGTCCQDFDLDGDEDIFVSNGHVIRYPTNAPLNQLPLLLENQQGRRLINVATSAGTGSWMDAPHMGRGAASADLDRDGDMDLVVSCTNQPLGIVENATPRKGTAVLKVRLIGHKSAREPVGASLQLQSTPPQSRYVKGGGSYGGSQTEYVQLTIADPGNIPTMQIRWPSGITHTVSSVPAEAINGLLQIHEPPSADQPPRLVVLH
ncbi:MAG: FG-GAP repeat domain-containing protein [Planctomyces sp.]